MTEDPTEKFALQVSQTHELLFLAAICEKLERLTHAIEVLVALETDKRNRRHRSRRDL